MFFDEDFQRYQTYYHNEHGYISLGKKLLMLINHAGLFAVVNHRFGCWILQKFDSHKKRYIRYFFNFFYYTGKKLSLIWGKIDVVDGLPIGAGLFIHDQGGVILGAISIGENCTILPIVTVGMELSGGKSIIGNNVVISSNSLVYGNIKVEDGTVIDTNTVLSKSIPIPCVLLKGNPVKIIKKNIISSDYIVNGICE